MPCTPFSDATILKILQCLEDNATTSASFRRTTQVVDILAKEYGLDLVHAETIQIGIWNDVEVEGIEIFGIQAAITLKRSNAERKKKKEKLLNGSNSCFTSLFTSSLITADFFLPEYFQKWYNYDKAVKAAYRAMKKVFEKAKSVDCIHFEKIPLNEEFLKKFSGHRSCIKESTTFIFRNERESTLNGCQITNMLNMMSLNSVHLATRFPAEIICLEDSHIFNLRSVILGAEHGEQMMEAPGITDKTLQYWKNNVPKEVKFNLVRTSFTLTAVWDYIEYVVAVKKSDLHYSFGVLSASTENRIALLQAQKTKYFNFAMNNSRFRRYQVVTYTMSLLSLSSDSLTRIFECLGDRASTITMLRRTCHQMNDLARKANFHKVNAKYIEKKPQDELDFMWDQKTADFKQYRKKTEYFKHPTYMESYGLNGNFTYWCEEDELKQLKQDLIDKTKPMLLRGLEKVKSIEELHFCNFIVSDDFVGILMNLSEHFSSLRHVKITHNYHQSFPGMEASSEQITNLLQIGLVESIHFDSEILEGVRDEHIQGIRTVTLIGYNGYTECPGITDATINAWMEDGSQSIYFEDIRTSITFKTLWRLIIDGKIGDCKYSFGVLRERTADDIKLLSEAQKARGIKWSSTTNSIDGEQLNTIHQLVVDDTVGKLTFTFNL